MRALVAVSALILTASTHAATEPPRERLSLQATASTELARDVIGVAFSTTKEGSDAAGVQAALKQALDAALTEARKIARPGQVDVQTGAFSLAPRYERGPAGSVAGRVAPSCSSKARTSARSRNWWGASAA